MVVIAQMVGITSTVAWMVESTLQGQAVVQLSAITPSGDGWKDLGLIGPATSLPMGHQ